MMMYFLTYPALMSVTIPTLVVLFILITHRLMITPTVAVIWSAGTLLSILTARWSITDAAQQLFILPIVGIWFLVKQLQAKQDPISVWALSFTSLLVADVTQAYLMREVLDAPVFYHGVGGAGMLDGLVVFPLLVCGIIAVDNRRK